MRRLALLALLPFTALWLAAITPQDPKNAKPKLDDPERAAVLQAARDYLDALYDAKPDRIETSVHPKLTKFGFYRSSASEPYEGHAMSYPQLVKLAKSWNRTGSKTTASSPRNVEVLDMLDQTAVVKLTAVWGIDYMHLGKFDGRWKIVHVLWQSHPSPRPGK